jgi:biotin carboxylase
MISIAHQHGYNSIYAGYGFMSEDADMVSAMEDAGLCFIGPGSHVQSAAGLKDEAKRTAAQVSVSVTPGVDDATTQAVLKKAGTLEALQSLAEQHELLVDWTQTTTMTLFEVAGLVLENAYEKGIDIYTLEEVIAALSNGIRTMFTERPHARVRLKAISGGGGKGQRILKAPQSYTEYSSLSEQIEAALSPLGGLVREVLAEVKCLGVGDNKNVVAELNVEETSHQEIQVVGNGEWCITMGGRDCFL